MMGFLNKFAQLLGFAPKKAIIVTKKETGAINKPPVKKSSPRAKTKSKRKPSVARQTTQVALPKQTPKPAPLAVKEFGADGSQLATPASKTPQRVKTAQKQKPKAVDSTTQGKKRTPSKTPAQTPTARQRKVRGS
jgi:hypothetical protein